ncbi:MAG: NADH-quinone oxidoreductase subunit NuoG [Candidatus Competibacteraceae bacterium]
MSEEVVKIEVDGQVLEARKGAMLIEVTDAAGIDIPRFCYHKKLSIAANCRMCLVEVERSPKPVPACATPVMEGMKVHTASPRAISAQKGTMEFLLINHPLDCPICDQGGECELQDLAVGYGNAVSRYQERKRVVKDKDIGPLVSTEMTRCIHCTRCVRFGEEIANVRELGGTGRGEHLEIGTYIEKSLSSELSGNVIDLCPVGALTAKPSRHRGRSWEYVQHPSVSPHDAVGSNLYLHVQRGRLMRVVPRENEDVNEVWLADRDRFSYEGIYSEDRALQPLVEGRPVEWNDALAEAAKRLRAIIDTQGADAVGVLASPGATVEELYLLQKLARGLGIANIDHRLRQGDFSDQESAPVYPWLGMPLAELQNMGAVLLVGSDIRADQPLAAHRLRKAGKAGATLMAINPRDFDFRFPVAAKVVADPAGMVLALAGVAKALAEAKQEPPPHNLAALLERVQIIDVNRQMAENLANNDLSVVLLGNLAVAHPAFAQLRALAGFIARLSNSALGYLPEGANAVGGWLAGVLPHRTVGGKSVPRSGLNARTMLEAPRKAYILLGLEPELDCWDSGTASAAVKQAEFVLNLTPYAGSSAKAYSTVLLPTATFAETSGSFINAEGRCQSFQGAVKPPGEARPAWKVLRVLGNALNLPGFDYMDSQEILEEVLNACEQIEPANLVENAAARLSELDSVTLWRVAELPMYATDALVRRAHALQQTPWARQAATIVINPALAARMGLTGAERAMVKQNGAEVVLPLVVDEAIPDGCVWVPSGLPATAALGPSIGPVELGAA